MSTQIMKTMAANAALEHVTEDCILGVGTGSTVNCLIEELKKIKSKIRATVASSLQTEKILKDSGFNVIELNQVDNLDLYIDGADAYNEFKQLVKGGGGALTREKIIATAAEKFICIVDESKKATVLGKFPVAIEVIPMARSFVARQIVGLKGQPILREGFITDNNNVILDVHNWIIEQPLSLEREVNSIPGVVCHGIFALRPADQVIIGHKTSVSYIN